MTKPSPQKQKPPITSPGRNGQRSGQRSKPLLASGIAVHCAHSRLVDVAELVPNPRNPNGHPDKQVALLAKIIRAQGWRAPIVVSTRSGFIVKGHGRHQAAQLLQVQQVPVDFQSYSSEAAEWSDLIADNQLAELADLSTEALSALVADLDKSGADLSLTALSAEELNQMLGRIVPDEDAPAAFIPEKFAVLVECATEAEQKSLLLRFGKEGLSCKALLS